MASGPSDTFSGRQGPSCAMERGLEAGAGCGDGLIGIGSSCPCRGCPCRAGSIYYMGCYCYDWFHRNATRVAIKWRGCRAAGGAGAVRSVAAGQADGMRELLARPRGFCAGVVRAIDIVELALAQYGPPV